MLERIANFFGAGDTGRTGARGAGLRPQLQPLEDRLQPTVLYYGGAVLPHVETQNVYLGSDWPSSQNLSTAQALDRYVGFLVNSPYMDALTRDGYGVGRGSASNGVLDAVGINKQYYLTDSQIRQQVENVIRAGFAQPDANRLYVVYVEPGGAVMNDHDYNAKAHRYSNSQQDFLGYHGAFAGTDARGRGADIHYAVLPYPGGYNPSPGSQGFATAFNELTAVSSHEIAEAVTDPNVNYKQPGWYDPQRGEIGDITEGYYQFLNGYEVQLVANKQDQPTPVTSGTIYHTGGGGGPGPNFSIAAPSTQTTSPGDQLPGLADNEFTPWGVHVR